MRIVTKSLKQVKKSKRNQQKPTQRKDYTLLFRALDHSLTYGLNSVNWSKRHR